MPNLVILTGAGISAESGIPTFRDANGLWEGHAVEAVASPEGFAQNPDLVHRFYNLRRAQLKNVAPNQAHLDLVRLEQKWRGGFLLVTQNVDDLHDRAGSKKLLHMHGELSKVRCEDCGIVERWEGDVLVTSSCQKCSKVGRLRPHIVWFSEMPFHLDEIFLALEKADIFISIGTSGQVYPAAGFVAHTSGSCRRIELNLKGTANSSSFSEHLVGSATDKVPLLVDQLLRGI